jgi:penicillin-binding protein 2
MAEATRQSCDVYFFSLAKRLGIDKIVATARQLGLGETVGALYGEKAGLIPSRSWKLLKRHERWSLADTILVAIGQGPVLVTPLQLATMIAHIANKGKHVYPTLVEETPSKKDAEDLGFRPETIALLQKILTEVCTTGTGRRARPNDSVYVAGKTGTAQVRRISMQSRAQGKTDTRDRPWEERDHALFIGYGPAGEGVTPRYAIALVIEHGGKGGEVAAQLARHLFEKLLEISPQEQGIHALLP